MNFNKLVLYSSLLVVSCSQVRDEKKSIEQEIYNWEELIDADLTKWDNYLSYQFQVDYDGSQPKNEKGEPIPPIGLNNPSHNVFTTFQENNDIIIRNTGEYYGCLITKKEFENYHFQLKYKWGDKKWTNRKELLKDSGILYHSIGPMAVDYWRSWMLSQEFQIMEGHTGDFWSQANSVIDIRAYKPESVLDPMAHESQEYLTFSMFSPYKNYCMRTNNYESPNDEWTTLDLICFEGKSLHMVNGKVVMILNNSRYIDENGKDIPLTKGKIQLQSEAAELFFKDIRIRKIDSLSQEQKVLF
ncbi:MAG: DUF1080 domain-containing protein [Maribacter sp.]|uniref:3-keto-disaccharide hydrolase n=1 Tax=Maribacter sp. TaxID=1897614 RepID=UPI003C70E22B